jgi:integrase
MDSTLIDEFELDWRLAGRAPRTAALYANDLRKFASTAHETSLVGVKEWLAQTPTPQVRRKRAQAFRAFGKWAEQVEVSGYEWWRSVPLTKVAQSVQETASASDYKNAIQKARTPRDRAIIELLWSCGLRRSELAQIAVTDVLLSEGCLVVRKTKNGTSRIVPLAGKARISIRPLLRKEPNALLLGISSNGIRLLLKRLDAPSAHAWRRGWAVRALSSGISEASLRLAAGWSSSVMVSRYTAARASDLALLEFAEKLR